MRFFGMEEAADRIAVIDLTAIKQMPVRTFAFESQDTETVGA